MARLVRPRRAGLLGRDGEVTELAVAPFSGIRAKPSAVTMQARPDGSVFMTKPGAGVAVLADPADSFRAKACIRFPVQALPRGLRAARRCCHGRRHL